jgi:hypothetical protein
MCNACSLKAIYSFPSAADFAAFDADLTHKLFIKQLTAVSTPALEQASAAFVCLGCPAVWVLSEPNNAWRGFFLPQAEAIRHLRRMNKATITQQLGCLVIVALFALLISWLNWP